ncbi:MAG TPA: hypothetical protein VKX16_14405, partial [Chloroflexota bacterium]|nr:hypothetical protein [Chloroflexota bacterium]
HRQMGAPAPEHPSPLDARRTALRCRLIDEEAGEFLQAAARGDWYEMIDALVDLLYVTYGTAVEMGVDLEPFFEEVHRANMRKVAAPDGGKSIKPEDWTPPDIAAVYRRVYDATPTT